MSRPDQSFYLAHFTKNGKNNDGTAGSHVEISEMSAFERLIGILENKKIGAFELPWTGKKAVCFTECPWGSLLRHAKAYSPYGIGFTKKLIYSRGGNPVIYANPNMFNEQKWDERIYPFVTPFVPTYAPDSVKNQKPLMEKSLIFRMKENGELPKIFRFNISVLLL